MTKELEKVLKQCDEMLSLKGVGDYEFYRNVKCAIERLEKLEKFYNLVKKGKLDFLRVCVNDTYREYLEYTTYLSHTYSKKEFNFLKKMIGE